LCPTGSSTSPFYLRTETGVLGLITHEDEGIWYFETSGTTSLMTQRNIPEDLNTGVPRLFDRLGTRALSKTGNRRNAEPSLV
jgi:hypothetical protein